MQNLWDAIKFEQGDPPIPVGMETERFYRD